MRIVLATTMNIVFGLVFEAWAARKGLPYIEWLVGLVTIAHLSIYIHRPPRLRGRRIPRSTLGLCLLLATFGEIVLSAVLGLYRYRQSFLPLFVPPGHVLLFLSGLMISEQRWCGKWLTHSILAVGGGAILYGLLNNRDLLSVPLFIALILFCVWGTERRLYAVMFALAWMLEVLGTSLGAWRWEQTAPYIYLSAANPPLAAGAFYACLDLLTFHLGRLQISRKKN